MAPYTGGVTIGTDAASSPSVAVRGIARRSVGGGERDVRHALAPRQGEDESNGAHR